MQQLKAKLKKQGGFTLIEMLIVVAIIAILIAISIPLVNGALEKARDATDQANERAAKGLALLYFMGATEDKLTEGSKTYTPGTAMTGTPDDANAIYYNAKDGTLTFTKPKGYGQCVNKDTCYGGAAGTSHIGQVIQVEVTDKGEFKPHWVAGATS